MSVVSESAVSSVDQPETAHVHPELSEPVLHIVGLKNNIDDEQVVQVLWECLRLRPVIQREGPPEELATGYIEFQQLVKAEKALATCTPSLVPAFTLSPTPVPPSSPPPTAPPLLLKSVPSHSTLGAIFDLSRPFGPVYKVERIADRKGWVVVTFYDKEHEQRAREELNCAEFEGSTISTHPFDPLRLSQSPSQSQSRSRGPLQSSIGHGAPPSNSSSPNRSLSAVAPAWTPQRSFSSQSQGSSPGDGAAAGVGVGAKDKGAIDPCNLYIKSLSPTYTSQDLYHLFSPFGQILSSRIMTDPITNVSKEFGFVSFTSAEQAKEAMAAVNGTLVEGRRVTVRYHEPKKVREGRLELARKLEGIALESPEGSVSDGISMTMSRQGSSAAPEAEVEASIPSLTEEDRLLAAVTKLEPERAREIVSLLMDLPKKERAMCLFNPSHLKLKVADALVILSPDSEGEDASAVVNKSTTGTATTPPASSSKSLPTPDPTPSKPSLVVPASLSALSSLPAKDIIALIHSDSTDLSSLDVRRVERTLEDETDLFMDKLEGKPVSEVKQKLGDRVFRVVKGFGVKGAPKITINLLDSEDLRSLAHLADYPAVLREKIGPVPQVAVKSP
ncbi:hypothetical protein T439DRAFT_52220 [Meredithblackwellia eburnea MCA 4105]